MLANAHYKALNFAVNTNIANKVTIKLMLARANAQMLSLASKVLAALDDDLRGALTNVPKPPEDKGDKGKEAKKEEKEEKKVSEDEAAAGLGALFG
jgi:ribosomal protein L12E/L44/L45/RPP1/RPP2